MTDSTTGCKIWNADLEPQTTIQWAGPCKDGLGEGHGALQIFVSGKKDDHFLGDVHAGKFHGKGVYTYAEGWRYDGDFRDGVENGRGSIEMPDGSKYTGEVKDGELSGYGVMVFPDGNRYEGQFAHDGANGQGAYVYKDGSRCERTFVDNAPQPPC